MKAGAWGGTVLATLALTMVLVGCPGKGIKPDVVQHSGAGTPALVSNAAGLTEEKTNFYVNGERVNFYSSRIEDIRRLLGPAQHSEQLGSTNYVEFAQDVYDGLKVKYRAQDGALSNVVIESQSFPVESGGRVGDLRKDISSNYHGGFYLTYDGVEHTEVYYYYKMSADGAWGIGFRFFFDGDVVTAIVVGGMPFVP